MQLQSLALQTDLIFARYHGHVTDRGDYLIVSTPSRPHYFWGNYLIMPCSPASGDLLKWQKIYNSEFNAATQGFMTFAIDSESIDAKGVDEFTSAGFSLKTNKVLTTQEVNSPPKFNHDCIVREIQTNEEWAQLVEVHYSDEWYLNPESQRPFLLEKIEGLRKMGAAGLGKRFGAFIKNQLVADLGIYKSGSLGRFNEVATHRNFRKQGLCGTLVYESAKIALQEMKLDTLVMEADENYHAARIYESVGFRPSQKQFALEWFDPTIHG